MPYDPPTAWQDLVRDADRLYGDAGEPCTVAELRTHLIDVYGRNPDRWPGSVQEGAEELLLLEALPCGHVELADEPCQRCESEAGERMPFGCKRDGEAA